MSPRIEYKASVEKDLKRLRKKAALRIFTEVEEALGQDGREGEPLSGEFAGLRKLRIGAARVIFARTDEGYLILRIAHHREGSIAAAGPSAN